MTPTQTKRTQENLALLGDPKVRAFLGTIAKAEGTYDSYDMVVYDAAGRGSITDFSRHPNIARTRKIRGKDTTSTAAGRYQIISKTYKGLAKKTGRTDFTPQSQDLNAVELLRETGAIAALQRGDFDAAAAAAGTQWAGMPGVLGKKHDQPQRTLAKVRAEYALQLQQAGVPKGTAQALAIAPPSPEKTALALEVPTAEVALSDAPPVTPTQGYSYADSLRDFLHSNTSASLDKSDLGDKLTALTPVPQEEPTPSVFDTPEAALSALEPEIDASALGHMATQSRTEALQAMFGGQAPMQMKLPDTVTKAIHRILGEETNAAA